MAQKSLLAIHGARYECAMDGCLESGYLFFIRKHYLDDHLIENDIPYECLSCDKKFATKVFADRHLQRIHTGRPFQDIFTGSFLDLNISMVPKRMITEGEHQLLVKMRRRIRYASPTHCRRPLQLLMDEASEDEAADLGSPPHTGLELLVEKPSSKGEGSPLMNGEGRTVILSSQPFEPPSTVTSHEALTEASDDGEEGDRNESAEDGDQTSGDESDHAIGEEEGPKNAAHSPSGAGGGTQGKTEQPSQMSLILGVMRGLSTSLTQHYQRTEEAQKDQIKYVGRMCRAVEKIAAANASMPCFLPPPPFPMMAPTSSSSEGQGWQRNKSPVAKGKRTMSPTLSRTRERSPTPSRKRERSPTPDGRRARSPVPEKKRRRSKPRSRSPRKPRR